MGPSRHRGADIRLHGADRAGDTGTWCPNRHDEAQYLVQLYKQHRAQAFEIVALDFEEPEQ
jgi:hypothetical protein